MKQRVAAESEARAREVEELKQAAAATTKRMDSFEGKEAAQAEENDLDNVRFPSLCCSIASSVWRGSG